MRLQEVLFGLFNFLIFPLLFQPADVTLEDGLIAYYPFNETEIKDHSGMGNHGDRFKARLENAHCGNPAYYFDGREAYLDLGNKDSLNIEFEGLTVSTWIKYKSIDPEEFAFILGKWAFDPLEDQFGLFLSPNRKISFAVGDGNRMAHGVYGNSNLEADQWYHVAASWAENGDIHIFINGEADGKGEQPGRGMNEFSTTSLKMGRQVRGENRPYHGYIDEVRIYRRTLNQEEIRRLYELGAELCNNMTVSGNILDAETLEPLPARITFEELESGKKIFQTPADSLKDYFSAKVPLGQRYGFYASAPGYIAINQNLDTKGFEPGTALHKDMYLVPLKIGQKIRINNLFFDFDKHHIRSESYLELNRLVKLLQKQATMKIEIAGHTDGDGSDTYNQNLSDRRAQAVREWLLSQGIDSGRVSAKGYGEAEPVADNWTDEGKQQNRRVELRIVEL